MQKYHGDSEHLFDLAGSTGYPVILPSDRGIVIDIEMMVLFAVVRVTESHVANLGAQAR